jgi:hypothetical protein
MENIDIIAQTLPPPDTVHAELLAGISGHDTSDRRNIMILFKAIKSPDREEGEPVADEETV